MILYTVMPQEVMFHNEADYQTQTVVNREGIPLLVEKLASNEYKVVRNLSTDPNHFLENTNVPGEIFTPTFKM